MVVLAMALAAFGLVRVLSDRHYKQKPTIVIGCAGVVLLALVTTMVIRHPSHVFIPETAIFIFALAGLFVSLFSVVKLMRSLVIAKVERLFHDVIFKSDMRSMGLGFAITAIIQSSSVTTSLAVPLAGAGIITTRRVFPLALGANVGTTVTALMAALAAGNPVGLAIAFAHLLFNLLGICVWYPLRRFPIWLAERFAALTAKSQAAPLIFLVGVYLVLPLVLITLLR
jgi:sodium-dependent phosphate cotransporter